MSCASSHFVDGDNEGAKTDPNGCRSKILLARSPEHLHAVVQEFKKTPGGAKALSLTKAIKTALPAGQIRSMLLYAVEGAKNDVDGACASLLCWD